MRRRAHSIEPNGAPWRARGRENDLKRWGLRVSPLLSRTQVCWDQPAEAKQAGLQFQSDNCIGIEHIWQARYGPPMMAAGIEQVISGNPTSPGPYADAWKAEIEAATPVDFSPSHPLTFLPFCR